MAHAFMTGLDLFWTTSSANAALFLVCAYFLGSLPFGLLLSLLGGAGDIRLIGSGNIGATNVLRTGRKGLAFFTLLLDAAKGALAVGIAQYWAISSDTTSAFAALAVVIGHCFPVWLRFKGGKGVATGLGALVVLSWPVGLACCIIWLGVAKLSKLSSLGALSAFVFAPGIMAVRDHHSLQHVDFYASFLMSVLVLLRHRSNISRLMTGRESRIQIDSRSQSE